MTKDDIDKKLKDLKRKTEQVEQQLQQSEDTLNSIDEQMADFKKRQTDRLNTDIRISDEVAQRVSSDKTSEE